MTDDRSRIPPESFPSDTPTGQLRRPAGLTVEVAGRTDKGRVRPGNEDAFAVESPTSPRARAHGTLLVVADGMGGHAAGEVASRLAVDTIHAAYYQARSVVAADAILDAITQANSAIFESAERDPARAGMGCTVVVLVVQGEALTIGHVGDSRAYMIRNARARQLTRDHSWVAMQVAEGILTPEQAAHHPNRSLIMRALGRASTVEIDIGHERLQAGDVLLVCSDGLTGVVQDDEIAEYATRYAPAALAEQLVSLANQRGAPDNVTVVIAAIASSGDEDDDAAGTTTTIVAPVLESPTPKKIQLPADGQADPDTPRPATSGSHTGRTSPRPAANGAPIGAPVIISRTSSPAQTFGIGDVRGGRTRWLAGLLAGLGLVVAVLLLLFMRAEGSNDTKATRPADAATPAVAPTSAPTPAPAALTPVSTATTVAIPSPISRDLPGVTGVAASAVALAPTLVVVTATPAIPSGAGQSVAAATPTRSGIVGTISAGAGTVSQVAPALGITPPAILAQANPPTATSTTTSTPTPTPSAAEAAAAPAQAGPSDTSPTSSDTPPDATMDSTAPSEAPPEPAPAPPPAAPAPSGLPPAIATRAAPFLRGR